MHGENHPGAVDHVDAELAHARELRRDKIALAVFVVVACVAIALWRLAGG
jgi:hypothetical protein